MSNVLIKNTEKYVTKQTVPREKWTNFDDNLQLGHLKILLFPSVQSRLN